jgi:hypothetical protein
LRKSDNINVRLDTIGFCAKEFFCEMYGHNRLGFLISPAVNVIARIAKLDA